MSILEGYDTYFTLLRCDHQFRFAWLEKTYPILREIALGFCFKKKDIFEVDLAISC
jgi:hypothetical protein